MTIFYLVRHGTRVDRSEETELSENGVKQVEQTAQYFKNIPVHKIYTSPLRRTQQTAKIINSQLNIPLESDDRLQERMIFDKTKKETFEEFLGEWDKTMGDRNYQPSYGVSAWKSGNRMKTFLDEISDDKSHLIISHSGTIGDILRNIFSDGPLHFKTDTKLLKWVEINECSITEIHKDNDEYALHRVNDTSHLEILPLSLPVKN